MGERTSPMDSAPGGRGLPSGCALVQVVSVGWKNVRGNTAVAHTAGLGGRGPCYENRGARLGRGMGQGGAEWRGGWEERARIIPRLPA